MQGVACSEAVGWSVLGAALRERLDVLTERQAQAVEAVLSYGTFACAAQAMATDRRNVVRLFRRALKRLMLAE